MYHVYCDDERITDNPISYNYLSKCILKDKTKPDWIKISNMKPGEAYYYHEFTIVKVQRGESKMISITSNKMRIKQKFPMFVKALDGLSMINAHKDGWNNYPAHQLPEDAFVILKMNQYCVKYNFMTYLNSKGITQTCYIPNQFKLKFLTKKEKIEIIKFHDEHVQKNMDLFVSNKYRIGSDPEIFVEDKEGNVIPAFKFLPGKNKPETYITRGFTHGIYWDGFQAEFSTQPETCLAWQVDSVQAAMRQLLKLAKAHDKNAKLSIKTCVNVDPKDLAEGAEEHVQFGCMPSLNIYGMEGQKVDGRELPYRSSGGHIHFGIGKKSKKEIEQIVKALDAILGVACVSLFAKYDDPKRRINYGLAGEYRLPEHGLEYRTLSNAWLCHPIIMNMVFDISRKVVKFAELGYLKFWKGSEKETIDCINNCDVKLAKKILTRNKKIMLQIIKEAYKGIPSNQHRKIYGVLFRGVQSLVKDPSDIKGNWELTSAWTEHSDGQEKNVYKGIGFVIETKKKVA